MLLTLLNHAVDFIAPKFCPGCGMSCLSAQQELCDDCMESISRLPEKRCSHCGGPADDLLNECRQCLLLPEPRPWTLAVSALPFEGSVRTWIHEFKYRRRLYWAPFFAQEMEKAWKLYGDGQTIDEIVPIPLHWFRFLQRGYNQTELLASLLAKRFHCPSVHALKRIHWTGRQAALDKNHREKNMRRAFACSRHSVDGKRILLIDDVFTTGATLTEATQTLFQNGAKSVCVLTLARDL